MVEPVPYVFERLAGNYGSIDRVKLENVAIGDRDGVLPFYYLVDASTEERARLPDWYDGIGSFSRGALLSHSTDIPDVESRLVTADVPTMTFESLCTRHGVRDVDLVLIDTEGYDWEILRSIDFGARTPHLVVYEHYHLAPEDRVVAAAHMERHGYKTMEEGFDTFCLSASANVRLQAAWDRLRPAVRGVSKAEEQR
jgi:FkbM family methyltransferase